MTMRNAWTIVMLLTLWVANAAFAAAPEVRVEVEAAQPVMVGQQVNIRVTVAAPNFFTSAPPFPTLSADGAIITMPDERGSHGVEQEGGKTVATISKTYVFVARRAGEFQLPQVDIPFTYQGDGAPAQVTLQLPATRITARLPEGAREGDAVLPAASLRITQTLDRDAKQLTAGDALVRTVQVEAANTQAMLIPPPEFEAPEGVRVFDADPVLSDHDGRNGGFTGGRRIDKVTYVFEKAGRYTLPAVELSWFDPTTRKPASSAAPAVEVEVQAAKVEQGIAPESPAGVAMPRHRIVWWRVATWAAGGVLLALLAWMAWRWRFRVQAWRDARARARIVSDDHMFDRALAACKADDAAGTYAALLGWARQHAHATPREWARELGDPALSSQLEALERQLFSVPASASARPWEGAALSRALSAAHRQWRHRRSISAAERWRRANARALQPLNPTSKRR